MANSTLKRVKLKERLRKIQFNNNLSYTINCTINDNQIVDSPFYKKVELYIPEGKNAIKIFELDTIFYAYLDDGKIYKLSNGEFICISQTEFTVDVMLTRILYDGIRLLLVVDKNKSYVYKQTGVTTYLETEVDLPFGNCLAECKGRLFIGKNDKLYFSEVFNYASFENTIRAGGEIRFTQEAGYILYLFSKNDNLYVVCKNKIFMLNCGFNQTDFTLTECDIDYIDIQQASIASTDDLVVFVSRGKLCSFDGKKLKVLDSYLDYNGIEIVGNAGSYNNTYILPVNVTEKTGEYVYCYDFDNNRQYLTEKVGCICPRGNVSISNDTKEIYRLTDADLTTLRNREVVMKELCLNPGEKSFLSGIDLYTNGDMVLKLYGDFGEIILDFKEGFNQKFCNVRSYYFTPNFTTVADKIYLCDFHLRFNIKGE